MFAMSNNGEAKPIRIHLSPFVFEISAIESLRREILTFFDRNFAVIGRNSI